MEKIINTFQRFAQMETKGKSPLYTYWSEQLVTNASLLALAAHIPITQPKPNLFFGAVQYVSMKEKADFYKVFQHPEHVDLAESFQQLVEFCTAYTPQILQIVQTKRVQTNEVQRASYLYPIFCEIAAVTTKPLTLIEIGTSAGLLLNVDQYHYEIEQAPIYEAGEPSSPLTIRARNLGKPLPLLPKPHIIERIGIDLHIVDLQQQDEYDWLQCLIWPELKQRKENLSRVRPLHAAIPKTLLAGDFRALLPAFVEQAKANNRQVVVFHTHVANQFPHELKEELLALLSALSCQAPIYHVYNNMFDAHLHVDLLEQGSTATLKTLQHTDGHGHYFYWV